MILRQNAIKSITNDVIAPNNELIQFLFDLLEFILKHHSSSFHLFQLSTVLTPSCLRSISSLINDYKTNGEKNFVPYEQGNNEIDNWLNGLNENN